MALDFLALRGVVGGRHTQGAHQAHFDKRQRQPTRRVRL
jgi:hypothetical protein